MRDLITTKRIGDADASSKLQPVLLCVAANHSIKAIHNNYRVRQLPVPPVMHLQQHLQKQNL